MQVTAPLSSAAIIAELGYTPANNTAHLAHVADVANPHAVTKTQVGLASVDNLQQLPLSYLDTDVLLAANSDVKVPSQKAVKAYADALVVGLLDDRGSFDASGNVFPSSGGSGTAGAILKGDLWFISVAGTLGGVAVVAGDQVRALADTPGQTAGNWAISEANIGFVPENIANKATGFGTLNNTLYPTTQAVADYAQPLNANLTTFAAIAPSANVQTLLGAANFAAFRTSLGVAIGSDVQAFNANLSTFAAIAPSANVQTLLGAADFAAFKTSLSLNLVENTALSSWAGSGNITTLGTIGTGSWNATAIPFAKLAFTGTPDGTKFLRDDGSWQAAGGGSGADTALSNLASVAINTALLTGAGVAAAFTATPPAAITTAQAGIAATLTASAAVAGSSVAGAAAGGSVTITAGAAARLTSGNANGGNINLTTGAGIGTGTAGQVITNGGYQFNQNNMLNAPLAYQLGTTAGGAGLGQAGGTDVVIYAGSAPVFRATVVDLRIATAYVIGWGSNTPISTGPDVAFGRTAAGMAEVCNGTLGTWRDLKMRQLYVDQTITPAGTTGNQTINKAAGTVNIAASGTTVTVTCSLCTTSSQVIPFLRTNDATAKTAVAVPGAGSFVITLNAAATAEVSIGFHVLNQ